MAKQENAIMRKFDQLNRRVKQAGLVGLEEAVDAKAPLPFEISRAFCLSGQPNDPLGCAGALGIMHKGYVAACVGRHSTYVWKTRTSKPLRFVTPRGLRDMTLINDAVIDPAARRLPNSTIHEVLRPPPKARQLKYLRSEKFRVARRASAKRRKGKPTRPHKQHAVVDSFGLR
jgi:hypothetical protein